METKNYTKVQRATVQRATCERGAIFMLNHYRVFSLTVHPTHSIDNGRY